MFLITISFLLTACRQELTQFDLSGASGEGYVMKVYDDHSVKMRSASGSDWVVGSWSGGIELQDTFRFTFDLNGVGVMRSCIVEEDGLRPISSQILE